jgi:hypothetical protein
MYEKKLIGRRPLYFRYAPPLTDLDAYSDDKLPKEPYTDTPRSQRSVYYYWWLFLKEHDGYRACCEAGGTGEYAALYADFGDVRDDDFMKWWKRGGRLLFCIPQDDPIHLYPSSEFQLNDEDRIVVSIPVHRDVDDMLAELKALLKPLRKHVPLRKTDKRAKYEVAAKPVLHSLHQHWQVCRLKKQNPNMKLYEIADELGIGANEKSDRDPKELKAIAVSRLVRQANTLIEYVGKGIFPITNAWQLKKQLRQSGEEGL